MCDIVMAEINRATEVENVGVGRKESQRGSRCGYRMAVKLIEGVCPEFAVVGPVTARCGG